MKNLINWKMFFILLAACVITALMVIPYSLALTGSVVELTPFILLLSTAQNIVLFALASFLGLLLSRKVGLGLPILEGALEGKSKTAVPLTRPKAEVSRVLKSILPLSVGLGLLAGVLIVILSIPFNSASPELVNSETSIPAWKALLASFYGGIAEEVLLRLFLVSLFVWISFKIKKTKDGSPTNAGIWVSIILAAVVFGLGHLPATSQITPLTTAVVIRAIVLNGVGGIIFGWLYWKKGLESAMIAHFSADIVLHIITPFAVGFFS